MSMGNNNVVPNLTLEFHELGPNEKARILALPAQKWARLRLGWVKLSSLLL